ncbi:MAG: helix-turn-helix transcriptional regulator [Clostridia bacterium]|nr:helix-turn-helix transcriptional regulator [Clostridia bacterium]
MAGKKLSIELSSKIQNWFWNWLVDHPDVSIRQLAKEIDVTSTYLYDVRQGTVTASIDKLVKLADYTGATLDEICGRTKKERTK